MKKVILGALSLCFAIALSISSNESKAQDEGFIDNSNPPTYTGRCVTDILDKSVECKTSTYHPNCNSDSECTEEE